MSLFLGGLRTLRAPATRSLRRSYSTPHAAPAQGSDTPWLPSSTAPPAQAKSSESTNEEPQQKDGAQGAAASKSEGEDAPRDDAGVSAEVPREQGSGEKSAEGKQMPSKLNPKDPREIPSKRDEDKVEENWLDRLIRNDGAVTSRPFPFYSIQHALSILFASGSGSSKLTRHTSSIDSFRCALICASMLCVFGVNSAMLLTGDTERELAGWRERSVVRRLRT